MSTDYSTPITLPEMILVHIRGSGPVTFPSICAWMAEQWTPRLDDYLLVAELTKLIHEGKG